MFPFEKEKSEYEKKLSSLLSDRTYAGFNKVKKVNKEELLKYYQDDFQLIIRLFDSHSKLIEQFRGFFNRFSVTGNFEIQRLLVATITRNVHQIYTSIKLTSDGDFGIVRASARQIFELLLLAKYSSLTENKNLANKWEKGGSLNIHKTVIKSLKIPKKDNILEFWNMLCTYNHGTTYSGQSMPYWKECERDIETCLVFIYILINCNYHLFNTVLLTRIPRIKHLVEYNYKENVNVYRKEFNESKRVYSKKVGIRTRRIINDYCRKWEFQ